MSNPVLVEVTRGALVESRHRGAVAVVDAEGKMVLGIGDVERPVFPRSAVKTMQALPLIESGAADAFGFGDAELSLACASHSGEAEHVALAASMLRRAGREADVLECGCHWPFDQHVLIELAKSGKAPTVLHNNCSGKHAGFIATSMHAEIPTEGYVSYDHPIQREIRGVMEALTGTQLGTDNCGTDGCAIPTYAVPLDRLADGFSRMLTGRGLEAERAKAARRLIDACMAEPFYMSGSKRACLNLMQAAPGRIFAKTGAEGVFCAVLPEQGLGIALKCDDGGTRASEAMIAGLLARLMESEDPAYAALDALANKTLRNWNGTEVGKIRATDALTR